MTAEGDNSVLMQKVAKELLAAYEAGKVKYTQTALTGPVTARDLGSLAQLIRVFEVKLLNSLKAKLAGKNIFDAWMYQESDLIQATSRIHGERICMEAFFAALQKLEGKERQVLEKMLHVFVLDIVRRDTAVLLAYDLIDTALVKSIPDVINPVIKDVGKEIHALVDAFDVKPWMLQAPIAGDWKGYNQGDWRGEAAMAKL